MPPATAFKPKAKNSLANLSRSCSTDRVLNLSLVYRNHRDTEEFRENPLFRNPRLNKSIFLKHTLRAHERELQTDKRMTVTKAILPFDTGELALGGFSCFLNEPELEKVIVSLFGGDMNSPQFQRDFSILRILDQLPTFDPFLLRERLRRDGIVVSRCYFDLTEADANRMRDFVQSEVGKIVKLALTGDINLIEQTTNMTQKLMTDETAASLDPLRQVLLLTGEEWRDGVFAWKGFLYYSWNIVATTKFMPVLQRELLEAKVKGATKAEAHEIDGSRRRISCCLSYLHGVTTDGVDLYRAAYRDLLEGKPSSFRNFLKDAPAKFMEVGEAFGMIMHIQSFWNFRFKNRTSMLTAEEALEIFRDFDVHVAGIYEKLD